MNARDKRQSQIIDIIGNDTLVDDKRFHHFHNQKLVREIMNSLGYEKVIDFSKVRYAHKIKERDYISKTKSQGV